MAKKQAPKQQSPKPLNVQKAAPMTNEQPARKDWRDPDATFSDDDQSLEAQMWRLRPR